MDTSITLHLAKYIKYLYEPYNVMVVFGEIEEINISRQLYEERHHIMSEMNDFQPKLLNACALAGTSLSDKESWGWSLTLPGRQDGYFVGMEPEGMICLRTKPAEKELAKVYLQRQKNDGPLMQSHFEPNSDCPVKMVEQYFNQVVQTQTRVIVDGNVGLLIQALPDADFSAIDATDDKALLSAFQKYRENEEMKPLKEFLVFYECRCDEKMIYEMIDKLSKSQQAELFENDLSIEVECPRCGREYTLHKKDTLN